MSSHAQDPERSERDTAGAVQVDPWGDFLSESSEELDVLDRELLTLPATEGGAADETLPGAPVEPPDADAPAGRVNALASVVLVESAGDPSVFPVEDLPLVPKSATLVRHDEASPVPHEGPEDLPFGEEPPGAAPSGSGEDPAASGPPAAGALRAPKAAIAAQVYAGPRTAPAQQTPVAIALADVVARQVPVRWPEAVAVVLELCAALTREAATGIPDAKHVRMTAAGGIVIQDGGTRESDVSALGRLLHGLLATSSTPLPLRLFVTSSIASPRFASIELYADALSHYAAHGEPDRPLAIRALYRRALDAAPSPPARRASHPAMAVHSSASHPAQGRRTGFPMAAACAAIACSAAIGVWVGRTAGPVPPAVPPTDRVLVAAAEGSPATAGAVAPAPDGSGASAQAPLGASARGARQSSEAPPQARPSSRPDSPRPLPAIPRTLRDAVVPTVGERAEADPVDERGGAPDAAFTVAGGVDIVEPAPGASADEPPLDPAARDTAIYSSADNDVEPPVALSGSSLRPLPLPQSTTPAPIELIINARGEVEHLSLVGRPGVMLETMWLFPLKYQKFRPAMKDGLPVPYRLYVR